MPPLTRDIDPAPPQWPTGFEPLYRSEVEAMVRVAFLIGRDQGVAEEIVNDAFVAVLERWDTLANPGGYLRTVVVRRSIHHRRRRSREQEVIARLHQAPSAADLPIEEMWDALGVLPVKQRASLVLRFYSDASYEQIAVALHCRPTTARSLVRRGLLSLRKEITR